jgi:hypothetical protein
MGALGTSDAIRKRLTVGPDRAILKMLFLPDGHYCLEAINGEAAGFERLAPVGAADGHGHADSGFSVDYRGPVNLFLPQRGADWRRVQSRFILIRSLRDMGCTCKSGWICW